MTAIANLGLSAMYARIKERRPLKRRPNHFALKIALAHHIKDVRGRHQQRDILYLGVIKSFELESKSDFPRNAFWRKSLKKMKAAMLPKAEMSEAIKSLSKIIPMSDQIIEEFRVRLLGK